LAYQIAALLFYCLGSLVVTPRFVEAGCLVVLSSGEPVTAVVSIYRRGGEQTITLSEEPLELNIPRLRYCSGSRFVWQPMPPPLVRVVLRMGSETYSVTSYGHSFVYVVEDVETGRELASGWGPPAARDGEARYGLSITPIEQRADGVWVLGVRFEPAGEMAHLDVETFRGGRDYLGLDGSRLTSTGRA